MGTIKAICGVALALALICVAVLVSHDWDPKSGIDPLYVILALVAGSFIFPAPRMLLREVLSRMSKLSFGGVEVTLQVVDAVAAAEILPLGSEEDDDGSRELRIVGEDWRKDPRGAVALLQRKLDHRLRWIEREIYATKIPSNSKTLERLRAGGLIKPFEERIAVTLEGISSGALARSLEGRSERQEAAVRFVERADRVVNQFRLIAFDARVRRELELRGLKILDIRSQPSGRWPDFYAYDPADEHGAKRPFRVVVRMATVKDSELIDRARSRLRRNPRETPLEALAQHIVVYPQGSRATPDEDAEFPALRYEEFLARIDAYMT